MAQNHISSMHAHRKRLLGLERQTLSVVTFNLGTNVVQNKVAGSEAEMVAACKQAYRATKGWTPHAEMSQCTENAIDVVCGEPFDLLALQELPRASAAPVLRRLQSTVFAQRGETLAFYSNQDTWLVANASVVGKGTIVTPPDLSILENGRAYLGVWFPHIATFVVALHAPHMSRDQSIVDPLKILNRQVAEWFEAKTGATQAAVQTCLIMGDFNEEICSQELHLLGKRLSCTDPHRKTKTCCYPDFKYRSDLIFASVSSLSIVNEDAESTTTTHLASDHRLARVTIHLL